MGQPASERFNVIQVATFRPRIVKSVRSEMPNYTAQVPPRRRRHYTTTASLIRPQRHWLPAGGGVSSSSKHSVLCIAKRKEKNTLTSTTASNVRGRFAPVPFFFGSLYRHDIPSDCVYTLTSFSAQQNNVIKGTTDYCRE